MQKVTTHACMSQVPKDYSWLSNFIWWNISTQATSSLACSIWDSCHNTSCLGSILLAQDTVKITTKVLQLSTLTFCKIRTPQKLAPKQSSQTIMHHLELWHRIGCRAFFPIYTLLDSYSVSQLVTCMLLNVADLLQRFC